MLYETLLDFDKKKTFTKTSFLYGLRQGKANDVSFPEGECPADGREESPPIVSHSKVDCGDLDAE